MTAITSVPGVVSLADRLAELRQQRDETLVELRPNGRGDDADRATNVDAHIRLEMLERRIADVEFALMQQDDSPSVADTVAPGRSVTLDFGDGPELYLVGSAEQAGPDVQVVTPDSALGRVLIGARSGFRTTYQPRPGHSQDVVVLDVA